MTNEIPDPEVYVTVDYSGLPPFADFARKNWWTCLQLNLRLDFPISEGVTIKAVMPATMEQVVK